LQDAKTETATDTVEHDLTPDSGCPSGPTECGGRCVNTSSEHDRCGACGNACAPAEVCAGGVCLFECPPGTVACSEICNGIDDDCDGLDDDCDGTPDDGAGCRIAVYRFWCTSDHSYKNNSSTPSGCVQEGGENPAWYNYASRVSGSSFSTTPLYRLYKGSINDHFYTVSDSEKSSAIAAGYIDEGNIGYCATSPIPGMTTPLFRLWKEQSGDHFYTEERRRKRQRRRRLRLRL
jgi:hypothetical protein